MGIAIAALLLPACAPAELPPLPLAMHIAADVSPVDAAAYRDQARELNAAVGAEVVYEVPDAPECGLRVKRGDGLSGDLAGGIRMTAPCQLTTRLAAGLGDLARTTTALHELAHASLSASDADHDDDPDSVMFFEYRFGQVLTEETIEAIRARLAP